MSLFRKGKKNKKPDEVGGLKARRRADYIRFADGIFCSAVFILIFALYCSARVGYFLLIALFAAPGVSVLWAFLTSVFIGAEYIPAESLVISKKDKARFGLILKNGSILPTALIRISVRERESFILLQKEKNVSVGSFGQKKVLFEMTAIMAGEAKAKIENICVEDFFGIARFPIKKCSGTGEWKFGVMPEIVEISAREPVLEEAMRTATSEDNSDESVDIISYDFSGFPGYDYRKYVPGDPLKRINSKLSAKRRQLMVRLDEKNVTAGVVFILDGEEPENAENNPIIPGAVENLIETALGMSRTLISRDFGVTVYYKISGKWQSHIVRSEMDIQTLAEELSFFALYKTDDGERIPESLSGNGVSRICFTVKADAELMDILHNTSGSEGDSIRIYNALTGEGRGL